MGATVLEHKYRPRGACRDAWHVRAAEVLVAGPAGTGKSRSLLEKLHTCALLNPGMKGLITRKTLVSLGSTALDTWRKFVIPEALAAGIVWYYGGSQEEPPQYRYENGSRIMIGGLDKPTKIMSSEYDMVYVQEAIELETGDWEAITTRLRNGVMSFQQLIADTNPDTPTHWLKVRCDEGKTVMLESRHEDNPVLFAETPDGYRLTKRGREYMDKLDALTGPRYLRLRKGLWVAAEGVIYDEYDPKIHLIDPFPIPDDWTRYWVVDFGYNHPFVLQWWAEDPDGRLYLYREIFHTQRTVDVHARNALAQVRRPRPGIVEADWRKPEHWEWTEPRPRQTICDHDSENRAQLERDLGMRTRAAVKSVLDGIQATQVRFRPAGDGKPRIFIFKNACVERDRELRDADRPTCTADEIPGYVWDTSGGKKIKEEPLKDKDDGCDCMRYIVAARDPIRRPNIRVL